ncbi:MAG: PHP domain-containing protein [Verrucomicrobiae bacterium]|nr:PHP domain-containing protein [Verrucomicrobiae bacterium]
MKLKFDLHSHSRFSSDGVSEPEDMIYAARERGLDGFAITDHNTCECVDYFLSKGYMREDGEPVNGLLIIPGQEVTTNEGHLLALGITLPDLRMHPPLEVCNLIHEKGGLAIPPHPYDLFRAGIREPVLDSLPIDALEVFNAATTLKRYNKKAFDYALKRKLPMTASSDAHNSEALGTAYTILETREFNLKAVLKAIRDGGELQQRYLTVQDAFRKTFNNIFRIRKPASKKAHKARSKS